MRNALTERKARCARHIELIEGQLETAPIALHDGLLELLDQLYRELDELNYALVAS